MKLQEFHFKKPVKILQVFKIIHIYGKADKSFENRKSEMEWKPFHSKSGSIANGKLFLPEDFIKEQYENDSLLITLEDEQLTGKNHSSSHNRVFKFAKTYQLDIFEIKDDLELFLKYDQWEIGIPERDNFKLAMLNEAQPVEIKINGKTDSSLTSGRERVFKEQQYIFNYLGEFQSAQLLKEPFEPVIKTIPAQRKTVDLIKTLW